MAKDIVMHLRQWGLVVSTEPGYKTRTRPFAFHPQAIVCHHTASNAGSGNFGSRYIVTNGRSDLPGPLAQFLLGRNGEVRVIAYGYCNHAGAGGPLAGMPRNMGNSMSYGIEAENNGIGEKWPQAQLNAYYRLCAAMLVYMGTTDVSKVIGHKEWTSSKIDPAGINMNEFRKQVKKAIAQGPSVVTVHLSSLKPGKKNGDVLAVKRRLYNAGHFVTKDPLTNYWGQGMTNSYIKYQKSLGFTGKDADGVPGSYSLERLGFNVVA